MLLEDGLSSLNFGTPSLDSVWQAVLMTPGVGVGITDLEGTFLFLNDTAKLLFFGDTNVDYVGKSASDFFVKEFVEERLTLFRRVIKEDKPLRFAEILFGRPIESILWPIKDAATSFDRVLVVSRAEPRNRLCTRVSDGIESLKSKFIDLGSLDTLSTRELEVFILLGQGLTVPKIAAVLYRSPKTIERHKSAIAKKLSLQGQSEIIYLAICLGIDRTDIHRIRLRDPRLVR